jgi:hypothetical protein
MSNICIYNKCLTRANFGNPENKIAEYCKTHKLPGMIDIKNKRCIFNNCNKQPRFGYPKSKLAEYCKTHSLPDMIDIKSKRCIFNNCLIKPNFGNPESKIAKYCKTHKLPGMIDIKNKRCIFNNCNKQSRFGNLGSKIAEYCKTHSLPGMIDIKSKRCIFNNCLTRANFGNPESKIVEYCKTHSLPGMIDIKNKHCKLCNIIRTQPKYKGYCYNCYRHIFPEDILSRAYKSKELLVVEYIKKEFPTLEIINDKCIGSSKCRPDIYIDFTTWALIIEIDENQHNDYLCENERMQKLLEDNKFIPITFIRFNPDKYIDHKCVKNSSCFRNTINGTVLNKTQIDEWDFRLRMLKYNIKQFIKHQNITDILTVKKLFYDGYNYEKNK